MIPWPEKFRSVFGSGGLITSERLESLALPIELTAQMPFTRLMAAQTCIFMQPKSVAASEHDMNHWSRNSAQHGERGW